MASHKSVPPEKDQRSLWKQPQPRSGSPASEPRQHRQRLKLSLPVNHHRTAIELTGGNYAREKALSNAR
jgi:hypothetical protein